MQNTNPATIGVHWGSVNLCCSQFGSIPIFNLSILNSYQSSGCCWVALCTLLIVITNLYKYAYTVGDKKSLHSVLADLLIDWLIDWLIVVHTAFVLAVLPCLLELNTYNYKYSVYRKHNTKLMYKNNIKSNIATNIFFIKINLPVIEKINKYVHKIIYVG